MAHCLRAAPGTAGPDIGRLVVAMFGLGAWSFTTMRDFPRGGITVIHGARHPVVRRAQGAIGRRYDAEVDSIIAVRVRLDSEVDRYFLTWGDLGSNRCWPGDIERAVLRASVRFALGGTPVDARVCDTLQAASGERYFYEGLVAMQQQMPAAASKKFTAWTDKMTAAVLRGEALYYLGAGRPGRQASGGARRALRVQPGVL